MRGTVISSKDDINPFFSLTTEHYLHLSMYIHLNPVRAGMVKNPSDYTWSSYNDYIGRKSRFTWLNRDEILSRYGTRQHPSRMHYRQECLSLIGQTPSFLSQVHAAAILGPAKIAGEILEKYGRPDKSGDAFQIPRQNMDQVDPEREIKRVAGLFGLKTEDLVKRHRNFQPKFALYWQLVENCGMPTLAAAKLLGISHAAVSRGIARLQKPFKEKLAKLNIKN